MQRWLAEERNVRFCALLGALTIAFSGIFVRLSHSSPSTAVIYRCVYALPVLAVLAWREDRRLGARSWHDRRFALMAGVLLGIDLLLWNHSIVDIGAGLSTVLSNVQVVVVPLAAWVALSERPAHRVLASLPVAVIGVLLISGALEHGAYGRDPTGGALYGVGAGVAYSGFLLVHRRGGADVRRPAGPLFDVTAAATVVSIIAGLIIGDAQFVPTWPSAGWLLALALGSGVFGWLLITISLPRLPAAITSLLLMLQPVGTVAFAALILGESPSALQLAGVGIVLIALITATYRGPGSAPVRRLGYAIAGASGNRSRAAAMSCSENSRSSS
jgi:drug/metabolite transporter (DMT)-like permease